MTNKAIFATVIEEEAANYPSRITVSTLKLIAVQEAPTDSYSMIDLSLSALIFSKGTSAYYLQTFIAHDDLMKVREHH